MNVFIFQLTAAFTRWSDCWLFCIGCVDVQFKQLMISIDPDDPDDDDNAPVVCSSSSLALNGSAAASQDSARRRSVLVDPETGLVTTTPPDTADTSRRTHPVSITAITRVVYCWMTFIRLSIEPLKFFTRRFHFWHPSLSLCSLCCSSEWKLVWFVALFSCNLHLLILCLFCPKTALSMTSGLLSLLCGLY